MEYDLRETGSPNLFGEEERYRVLWMEEGIKKYRSRSGKKEEGKSIV